MKRFMVLDSRSEFVGWVMAEDWTDAWYVASAKYGRRCDYVQEI